MSYTDTAFEKTVEKFGEVFFVLDSGAEYIVHGKEGYEFEFIGNQSFVRVEGRRDDEYIVAEFPLDSIEHHYTHKEV